MFNKKFKDVNGNIINIVNHTLDVLRNDPEVSIHIGTDSQNIKSNSIYVVVIAYRYGYRGVHYIFHKHKIKKISDIWTRLWKEVELSIELAEWLTFKINVNVQIDMDYNDDDIYKSHALISSAKGWANSLGYKVNVKPNNQIATRAADYHCH